MEVMKCSKCGCSEFDACLVHDANLAGGAGAARGCSWRPFKVEDLPSLKQIMAADSEDELHSNKVCDACEPGAGVTKIRGPLTFLERWPGVS